MRGRNLSVPAAVLIGSLVTAVGLARSTPPDEATAPSIDPHFCLPGLQISISAIDRWFLAPLPDPQAIDPHFLLPDGTGCPSKRP